MADAEKLLNGVIFSKNLAARQTAEQRLSEFCRNSPDGAVQFADSVLDFLRRSGSVDRRVACAQLADVFFRRSRVFRERLIEHLQDLISHTLDRASLDELNIKSAGQLTQFQNAILKIVHGWCQTYGLAYRKLQLISSYLKSLKTVDWDKVEVISIADQRKRDIYAGRQKIILNEIESKLSDVSEELESCLNELENGFDLLVAPLGKDDDQPSTAFGDTSDDKPSTSRAEACQVILEPKMRVHLDQDNEALLAALKDSFRILQRRFSPKLAEWSATLKDVDSNNEFDLTKIMRNLDQRRRCVEHKFQELDLLNETATDGLCDDQRLSDEDSFTTVDSFTEDPVDLVYRSSHDKCETKGEDFAANTGSDHTIETRARDWKQIAFEDKQLLKDIRNKTGVDLTDSSGRAAKNKLNGTAKSRIIKKIKLRKF